MRKFICLLLCVFIFSASFALQKKEHQTLADYLYYLTKYITWPDSAFNSDEFNICVAHNQALYGELSASTKNLTAAQLPIKIKEINHPDQIVFCQMVFVGKTTSKQASLYIKKAQTNHALTLSLQKGFVENGGMIEFYEEDHGLQFDININQAQQEKYKVSAQLLRMVDRS